MASFPELYILQEEEKAMLKMSNMLNDQLKRLQVRAFDFVMFCKMIICNPNHKRPQIKWAKSIQSSTTSTMGFGIVLYKVLCLFI